MKDPQKNLLDSDLALRLKSVFDTVIDGIITISDRGIIQSINPAGAELFGYKPEEIIGENVKILMPNPDRERHDSYLDNYKRTRNPQIIGIGREVIGLRKNGKTFPMRLAVSEVRLKNEIIYTGITHDLTEIKEAEYEIRKLNEDLEQKVKQRTEELASAINKLLSTNQQLEHEVKERKAAEKALILSLEKEKELNIMKSRFLSMASHQFRTPLSSILSSAELITAYEQEAQQAKREKHINRIKSSVEMLTDILNDFLSLSKLEEGKIELDKQTFILEDFCNGVREETLGILKPEQKIIHKTNNPKGSVYSDKKLLKNVILNLLSNAIKYSDPGQEIECNFEVLDDQLTIEIVDNGIGIPKEDHKHLFTRFFRAHNSENIQGTGLGLNIAQKYVHLLDGEISFKSELGRGSTFTVRIPLELV